MHVSCKRAIVRCCQFVRGIHAMRACVQFVYTTQWTFTLRVCIVSLALAGEAAGAERLWPSIQRAAAVHLTRAQI